LQRNKDELLVSRKGRKEGRREEDMLAGKRKGRPRKQRR
jgi:hypothetical protein